MHYYKFNIGDYRRKTHHLSLLEHGIYRSLLDTYYLTEHPLCGDHANLMRTHAIRTDEEKAAFDNVLADFFELEDHGYTHSNCDEELAKVYEKSEKARISAEARWAKKEKGAKGMRKPCESNQDACDKDANALNNDANGMLPITHYPLPTTQREEKPKAKRFSQPSQEDVGVYFLERGHQSAMQEAENFIDFYSAKGWMIGKNKMKDWKAAVRNWMKNDKNFGEGNAKSSGRDRTSTYDITNTDW